MLPSTQRRTNGQTYTKQYIPCTYIHVYHSKQKSFLILSDSISALQSIHNHPILIKIRELYLQLIQEEREIVFVYRCISFERTSDFKIATLPSGVMCLFVHILIVSANFSEYFIFSQFSKLFVNQIPSILNLGGFHFIPRCCIYLTTEFHLLPNQTALVFHAFICRPDFLPKLSITVTQLSNNSLSPAKRTSVSSTYCESVCSMWLTKIHFISLFSRIMIPNISTK